MRFNFETMRRSLRIFATGISASAPRYFIYPCWGFSKLCKYWYRTERNIKYFSSIGKAWLNILLLGKSFWFNFFVRSRRKVYRNMNKNSSSSIWCRLLICKRSIKLLLHFFLLFYFLLQNRSFEDRTTHDLYNCHHRIVSNKENKYT